MTTCSYCAHPATTRIIANPGDVCFEHALEFWTGLLIYSHGRSGPCVRQEMPCTCPRCEELTAMQLRAAAAAGVTRSPGDHEGFAIRLAS